MAIATPSPTPAAPPPIYTHPSPRTTLLPHLVPLLPHSLPLVRRIQFHFHSSRASVLSTIDPSTPPSPSLAPNTAPPFVAAYLDRSRVPETECWLFSTVELSISDNATSPRTARIQLLALLTHINAIPLPPSFPSTKPTTFLLVGALHRRVLQILKDTPTSLAELTALTTASPTTRPPSPPRQEVISSSSSSPLAESALVPSRGLIHDHTIPYIKFLIPPPPPPPGPLPANSSPHTTPLLSPPLPLPPGLEWSTVHPSELAHVLGRTGIPRTERTMALLSSVAIRTTSPPSSPPPSVQQPAGTDLVAWAFLGPDGSLTTLHVTPAYRNRKLASLLTTRLFGLVHRAAAAASPPSTPSPTRRSPAPPSPPRRSSPSWLDNSGVMGESMMRGLAKGKGAAGSGFVGVTKGGEWCHSDVAGDNVASCRVARAVGGKEGWECYWAWVDLAMVGRAQELVRTMEE